MIALMVRPLRDEPEAWRELMGGLTAILRSIPEHSPLSDRALRFRWPPGGLLAEARATARGGSMLRPLGWALVTSAIQFWCHLRGARVSDYDAPRYLDEVKAQTDFRKFDGCLRVVLDCTVSQVTLLETWLEAEYRAGRLVWGMHKDSAALMTCLVFSLQRSEHVHFIDAAGGGFAKAAEGFKRRLQALDAAAPGFPPESAPGAGLASERGVAL